MQENNYKLNYLPRAKKDLYDLGEYIAYELNNPNSALKLVDKIEKAIHHRLTCPKSFEPYRTSRKREHTYFRIYIDNFTVYYVVIGDTMEIRRIMYNKRYTDKLLD